ncbi:MAG: TRAP transporter large permease, partial [Candidatus Eiseniibacteriota bacterium]
MSPLHLGLVVVAVTTLVLASGIPVAFGLGVVSVGVLIATGGLGSLSVVSDTLFGGLNDFTLISIPMFILMGAAVASSRAGGDLYEALSRWFNRLPGSLVIANIGACALFAALTGSSPATAAAIGKMGIPEMRRRAYGPDLAAGAIAAGGTLGILIPPSITMILYGIASETSIGRLFLAGVLPGLMLTGLFILWALILCWRRGDGALDRAQRYSLGQMLEMVPRVGPFIVLVAGVVYALYGGIATPSEAAGVGAFLALFLVVVIYRVWRVEELWRI